MPEPRWGAGDRLGPVLMLCYARSGGTLLNRCLGMLPDTVVLSEVNPSGSGSGWSADSPRDIPAQARAWYGIEISAGSYVEQVQEADAWCREHGRHLIIRD